MESQFFDLGIAAGMEKAARRGKNKAAAGARRRRRAEARRAAGIKGPPVAATGPGPQAADYATEAKAPTTTRQATGTKVPATPSAPKPSTLARPAGGSAVSSAKPSAFRRVWSHPWRRPAMVGSGLAATAATAYGLHRMMKKRDRA